MTMLDVGRCIGSGESPREGSEHEDSGGRTGVCPTCSGRFEVEHGKLVQHESAPEDERESTVES